MDMHMDSMQRISQPKAEGDYNVIRIGAGGGISLCESSAKKSTCYAHDISADEEDLINRLHKLLGDRWSLIAGRLPWRRVEEIQNYCDSIVEYDKKSTCSAHDISADEEELINRLHKLLGDRWALIAGRLPWRKVEEIENYCKMRYTASTSSSHS